ncbi:MAG: Poly-beta,6-N-acetyl-D-glucosamine N-deacetylase PgaB [Firmicutes bacterium]|nr:Poly-beta,6-N-acetyl-D-glucosamine N-deacetylase PgaB [Bacillota bacterium]
MVRKLFYFLLTMVVLLVAAPSSAFAGDGVLILCYHDVGTVKPNDYYAISKDNLAANLEYLKKNGYHPISLQQYIDANSKGTSLPPKPVLLTFDDGYVSFYNNVFPMLKKYNYPAVLAVVTNWEIGYKPPDVGKLVNWQQMREMEASGLVNVVSHTHNLHHSTTVNSYRDRGEAGSNFEYGNGASESLEQYKARIDSDCAETQAIFERELGHKALALVWPYGEYTTIGMNIAKTHGFKALFTLGGGLNVPGEKGLFEARRGIILSNPDTKKFAKLVKKDGANDPPLRAVWVNIDGLYNGGSIRQTDANVKAIISRLQTSGINTVFLQAFSTSKTDGSLDGVYFSTAAAPVKVDIYDHIARLFKAQSIDVYAWMPTNPATVLSKGSNSRALYSDLAAYSYLDGVIFQDDLPLKENKDFIKPKALTDQTVEMAKVVLEYKPYAKFVRSIYPEAVKASVQDYNRFLKTYDYTLILAYPYRERREPRTLEWTQELAKAAFQSPGAANKLIFTIQSFDYKKNQWLDDAVIKNYMKACHDKGALYFAFYPDTMFTEKGGLQPKDDE